MKITVDQACHILKSGGVVALPTDTVYGLACCFDDQKAVENIFHLKKRPQDNPLIVHVSDIGQVRQCCMNLPKDFEQLANVFWPGPLTLVIPCSTDRVPKQVRAGLSTCAFRQPNHPIALEVIKNVGPIVMPSCNLASKPSATESKAVEEDFGKDFPVVEGGENFKGIESTILIWQDSSWRAGRLGVHPLEDFVQVLGYRPKFTAIENEIACPGQKYRHYAPNAKLILSKQRPDKSFDAIVGFDDRKYPASISFYSIGKSSDAKICASRLYQVLRQLDRDEIKVAWVDMDFPNTGLFEVIRERLKKASL